MRAVSSLARIAMPRQAAATRLTKKMPKAPRTHRINDSAKKAPAAPRPQRASRARSPSTMKPAATTAGPTRPAAAENADAKPPSRRLRAYPEPSENRRNSSHSPPHSRVPTPCPISCTSVDRYTSGVAMICSDGVRNSASVTSVLPIRAQRAEDVSCSRDGAAGAGRRVTGVLGGTPVSRTAKGQERPAKADPGPTL